MCDDSMNTPLEKDDYLILLTLLAILVGATMTVVGIFLPVWEFMVAIGLPLWIFSTVMITKNLTFSFMRDINDALEMNK